ncbi:glycosyltransferase [Paracoccus sp. N5]|uniref:glycosyltransferase n=1 Tax=Paracoccus sp. N5 TaxID=1101189 RepID=UPI0003A3C225|nr:glycosyltransferase [Paracoccus sp. N5]
MREQDIAILGVCRFSMLGRGDWKAYRNKSDDELEAIYEDKAAELFAAERMEARLATFEHLTLASMRAQSDPNFRFLVLSSDRMPEAYRTRLEQICAVAPQVELRFVAPMHVSEAITMLAPELALNLPDTVQFRLDDDDCVSKDFIRRLRRHAACLWRNAHFAVSFSSLYYCVTDGPTEGIYNWYSPFFSAGAAVRHSTRTVFDYGHYKIPQHLVSVTDPHFPCIVTHRGDNDTPRHEAQTLRKRGMTRASEDDVRRVRERHFGYLSAEGMALCTFDKFVDTATGFAEFVTPDEQEADEAQQARTRTRRRA